MLTYKFELLDRLEHLPYDPRPPSHNNWLGKHQPFFHCHQVWLKQNQKLANTYWYFYGLIINYYLLCNARRRFVCTVKKGNSTISRRKRALKRQYDGIPPTQICCPWNIISIATIKPRRHFRFFDIYCRFRVTHVFQIHCMQIIMTTSTPF